MGLRVGVSGVGLRVGVSGFTVWELGFGGEGFW